MYLKKGDTLDGLQKVAVKLIMGENKLYSESLKELKITTLEEIQNYLSVKFARKCLTSKDTSDMIKKRDGVGPIDNRPSTDKLQHLVKKKM